MYNKLLSNFCLTLYFVYSLKCQDFKTKIFGTTILFYFVNQLRIASEHLRNEINTR